GTRKLICLSSAAYAVPTLSSKAPDRITKRATVILLPFAASPAQLPHGDPIVRLEDLDPGLLTQEQHKIGERLRIQGPEGPAHGQCGESGVYDEAPQIEADEL